MSKVISLLFTSLALLLLAGCADEERTNLFEAQLCIDKIDASQSTSALSSSVDSCLSKISGQSTGEAYTLRCAGDFIKQGIAETALVTAMQDLDEGGDSTAATMEIMAFDTTTASATAVGNCNRSGSTTLAALANLASISTLVKTFGGTDVQNFIDNYNATDGDPAGMTEDEKVQLANTIIASQSSLCDPDSGLLADDNEVCENINAAAAGGATTDAEKAALVNDFIQNSQN